MAALLGTAESAGTIGGALAANLSGPRRIKAGAARDHFLGVSAVSGRGETFKSGGRVVKNVTGYDLCKLLAGSWGTLAAMTDVTVKTLPRAETEETVLVRGLDDATAAKLMAAVMGSFADASAAAHLPAPAAARIAEVAGARAAMTAFRLEGVAPSIAHRKGVLGKIVTPFGASDALAEAPSRAFWRAVRDVAPFAAAGPAGRHDVWRISTAPSARRRGRPHARRQGPAPRSCTTGPADSSGPLCRLRTMPARASCARPLPRPAATRR